MTNRITAHLAKFRLAHACVAFPFLCAAHAAETARDTADSPLINLDAITVSATRTAWRTFDVPGMTSVVDGKTIELLQPQSVDDLLRLLPNVELYGGPRRTAEVPRIRGRNQDNVLVLIDGTRQNFNVAHRGRYFVEPDLLKQVEVVRGPNSALYGSGAQGGILAMQTKDASDLLEPQRAYGSRLKAGYVSANDETFFSAAAYGAMGALDVLASASQREGGDIRLGTGDKLPFSGSKLRAGLAKATWRFGAAHAVSVGYDAVREDNLQPTNPQGSEANSIVRRKGEVDNLRARYVVHPQDSDWLDLEAVAYRVKTGSFDRGVSANLRTRDERRVLATTGFSALNRSSVESPELGRHRLVYGTEFFRDDQTARRFDTGVSTPLLSSPEGSVAYAAAFFQDEISLPGRVTLIPGIRYDEFNAKAKLGGFSSKDGNTSLKIGAVWRPRTWLFLFGLYSEGFLTPDVGQIFRSGTHFRIGARQQDFVPSLDLKPESSQNYEGGIGAELKLADQARLQAKLSVFTQRSKDTLSREVTAAAVPAELAAIGITRYEQSRAVNLAGARFAGAELEIGYTAARWFLNGGASTLSAKEDGTGRRLDTTPGDKLSLTGGVRWSEARLTLGGSATFVGNRRSKVATPQYQTSGYDVWGLFLVWQPRFAGPDASFNLTADNLFDKAYARDDRERFDAGRSVQVAVTTRF